MNSTEKVVIVLATTSAIVVAVVVGLVLSGKSVFNLEPVEKEQTEQTFYVATPGGEAFKVNALHKCGAYNMREAAIQATFNQTEALTFRGANEILVAVTMDYARINEGNVREGTRCEITGITFTNITGKAYIVEETE